MLDMPIILADVTTVTLGILAIGALFASAALAKRSGTGGDVPKDDTPTTISTQGATIPVVLGRRRVGPVFILVDTPNQRIATPIKTETGGKGFGGGGSSTTGYKYQQREAHILCCACSAYGTMKLLKIYDNDKALIWSGEITNSNSPSGTSVTTDKHGTFRIYWGETTQGQDDDVADLIGFNTLLPGVVMVVWDRANNGESARSIPKEYVVEVRPNTSNLVGAGDAWLNIAGAEGMNAAHALYVLLTFAKPLGVGFGSAENFGCDKIDATTFAARGQEADTGGLAVNMLIGGDAEEVTGAAAVEAILSDMSWSLSLAPDGRLAILSAREPGTIPTLSADVIERLPDVTIGQGSRKSSQRIIYQFDDEKRAYRTSEIRRDNAGLIEKSGHTIESTREITTVTHGRIAQKVANRREQEDLGDSQTFQAVGLRGSMLITPGQAQNITGIGQTRLIASKPLVNGTMELDGIIDVMGNPEIDDDYGDDLTFTEATAYPDLHVDWLELPDSITGGGTPKIAVFRVRYSQAMAGAYVHISGDGGAYTEIGQQIAPSIGGVLDSAISAGSADPLVAGPTFEPQNDDIELALDLSSDESAWNNGRQLLIIDDEVMFLESVTSQSETAWAGSTAKSVGDYVEPTTANGYRYKATVAGTTDSTEPTWPTTIGATVTDGSVTWECHRLAYQLDNIQRAKYGTTAVDHVAGAQIYIIDADLLSALSASVIADGVTVCVKTQPYTTPGNTVNISAVTAVCRLIGTATRVTTAGDTRTTDVGDTRIVS